MGQFTAPTVVFFTGLLFCIIGTITMLVGEYTHNIDSRTTRNAGVIVAISGLAVSLLAAIWAKITE